MKALSNKETLNFKIVDQESKEYHDILSLREAVLRKPLGSSFSEDEIEYEKNNIHIAAFMGKKLCATCDLVPLGKELKMKRVAVAPSLQSKGVGSSLMKFCEEFAKENAFQSIYCYARTTAVNFYSKNHFKPEGGLVDTEGFPHQKMRNILN